MNDKHGHSHEEKNSIVMHMDVTSADDFNLTPSADELQRWIQGGLAEPRATGNTETDLLSRQAWQCQQCGKAARALVWTVELLPLPQNRQTTAHCLADPVCGKNETCTTTVMAARKQVRKTHSCCILYVITSQ